MPRYAITDIHGCVRTFYTLLAKIDFTKEDELFLLGDYIDRGPKSRAVVDRIMQLQEDGYRVQCLRGNHEAILLETIDGRYHIQPYQKPLLSDFGVSRITQLPRRYYEWFSALPYYILLPDYILVHAGLNFQWEDPLKDKESLLYLRDWDQHLDRDWLAGRTVLHGHTPVPADEIKKKVKDLEWHPVLGLDAGCSHTTPGMGELCAFNMDTREVTFVEMMD
ncbi:MAG: metallophosphoesterase family protein [Saprospiraceae bacterium]